MQYSINRLDKMKNILIAITGISALTLLLNFIALFLFTYYIRFNVTYDRAYNAIEGELTYYYKSLFLRTRNSRHVTITYDIYQIDVLCGGNPISDDCQAMIYCIEGAEALLVFEYISIVVLVFLISFSLFSIILKLYQSQKHFVNKLFTFTFIVLLIVSAIGFIASSASVNANYQDCNRIIINTFVGKYSTIEEKVYYNIGAAYVSAILSFIIAGLLIYVLVKFFKAPEIQDNRNPEVQNEKIDIQEMKTPNEMDPAKPVVNHKKLEEDIEMDIKVRSPKIMKSTLRSDDNLIQLKDNEDVTKGKTQMNNFVKKDTKISM